MFPRGYILLTAIALLAIVSISIVWELLTANYPTHSDIFFMGVEAGVLAVILLVCLVLIGFLLYRIIALPKKAFEIKNLTTLQERISVCFRQLSALITRGNSLEFYIASTHRNGYIHEMT